jgi:hypothetical protein
MATKAKKEEATMSETATLAKVENNALATGTLAALSRDELEGMSVDMTGLEDISADDFRLASLVWNLGGIDEKTNQERPKTMLFNTLTEESVKSADLALLVLHKSRQWAEFVQDKGTVRRCSSWDNIEGRTESGQVRKCAGCPDYGWQRGPDGKNKRNCGDVHNVVASDLEHGGELVMLRLKKTGLDPWKTYLNKHFLGKRVVNGARTHYPLFTFKTKLSLKLEKNGSNAYALPVFERGEVLSGADIAFCLETARGVQELYLDRVREVAESTDSEGGADDTGFDYGANAKGFIDTKAEPETATRFE